MKWRGPLAQSAGGGRDDQQAALPENAPDAGLLRPLAAYLPVFQAAQGIKHLRLGPGTAVIGRDGRTLPGLIHETRDKKPGRW
jgi:hypothetical protein